MKFKFLYFIILPIFNLNQCNDIPISELITNLNITQEDLTERGEQELASFVKTQVWKGGYYEGDPTNPRDKNSYHRLFLYNGQLLSPFFICYTECLKPYINNKMKVLEIGTGRGAWTKAIIALNPFSVDCVDALSASHNEFWKYVGNNNKITYHQISDFSLNCIENNSIDFVFSFGTFCHISPLMVYEYFKNLFPKLCNGAEGFIMYADFDKKNNFAKKYNLKNHMNTKGDDIRIWNTPPSPTWFHMGIERMHAMLTELGYKVISADIDINERDPIVHFKKE